ncbi:hypothetical protein QBC33DRAFT_189441 [Phialemonium atrogriseum]|uniref:Uncharacterized protein n=1 Tax=Phialemonium atrogriseum TaxID=1093897 RepID=A0AAJ0BUP0_9PEZI|nr:uncharacterized protein QBC33DRAFT_189441 [Phialemonium atrogriseum]KAK1764581.1 hypothetical protein QBC33DRAFT_189441 [Phialemonium atrogriseum]
MAEPPRQPREHQGRHQLPKEELSSPSEPPPAYVPPAGAVLLARLGRLFNNNPELTLSAVSRPEPAAPPPNPLPSALAHLAGISASDAANRSGAGDAAAAAAVQQAHEPADDPWDDDHSECEDLKSPITIRINAGIRISSNSNVVTLAASPADTCARIAQAVVAGMREASGGVGIPMIDEDGHPRPLRIEVDAGLDINGAGNVVGREDVVRDILRMKAEAAATRRAEAGGSAAHTPASSRVPSGSVVPDIGSIPMPGSSRVPSGVGGPGDYAPGLSDVSGNAHNTAPAPAPVGATATAAAAAATREIGARNRARNGTTPEAGASDDGHVGRVEFWGRMRACSI